MSALFSDTRMLAGTELYQFARVTYKMSKIAASLNVPGTKRIVDDLGILYAPQGRSTQPDVPLAVQ